MSFTEDNRLAMSYILQTTDVPEIQEIVSALVLITIHTDTTAELCDWNVSTNFSYWRPCGLLIVSVTLRVTQLIIVFIIRHVHNKNRIRNCLVRKYTMWPLPHKCKWTIDHNLVVDAHALPKEASQTSLLIATPKQTKGDKNILDGLHLWLHGKADANLGFSECRWDPSKTICSISYCLPHKDLLHEI